MILPFPDDTEETRTDTKTARRSGELTFIGVPIGNRDDITMRALRKLQEADVVVCEEFKTGAALLRSYNLSKKLLAMNEHNESEISDDVLELVRSGKRVAVISDAGMPVMADPGALLAGKARAAGIDPVIVPGVSSITAAVVASGFSCSQFDYIGFLSRKLEERQIAASELATRMRTLVILETPYRLRPLLAALAVAMPDRRAALVMNLTMPTEGILHGTVAQLNEEFGTKKFRGEFVLVIDRMHAPPAAVPTVQPLAQVAEGAATAPEPALGKKPAAAGIKRSGSDEDDQRSWLDENGMPLRRSRQSGGGTGGVRRQGSSTSTNRSTNSNTNSNSARDRRPKIDNQASGFGYPARQNKNRFQSGTGGIGSTGGGIGPKRGKPDETPGKRFGTGRNNFTRGGTSTGGGSTSAGGGKGAGGYSGRPERRGENNRFGRKKPR